MKRIFYLIFWALIACGTSVNAARVSLIERVEPLCWWTDMACDLTLLVEGEGIGAAQVSVKAHKGSPAQGLVVKGQHAADHPDYLFVDVDVRAAGTYGLTFKMGKKTVTWDYTIYPRREGSRERLSFSSADMVYLLMPDRFVDGDPENNTVRSMAESAEKNNIQGRFGGDIQGIISQLDHIAELGATAIWSTPLLEDNEKAYSYHGYACSDYYHIDPRYGSNELYREMVRLAHTKGLKIIMDMVPNHCGSMHWWMDKLPYPNWVSQWDTFTTTNNIFSAYYDIHASQFDKRLCSNGWFDTPMPDMNVVCPDLLHYFKQWAIWWIEYADLDGLRVDTYPYIEPEQGAQWLQAIREEYPNINIVGECWTRPASAVAYWQDGVKNANGFRSWLPTVMDFPLEEAIRQALENDGNFWDGGMMRVYNALAQDYLYADVNKLWIMLGNHDMDHIADAVYNHDLRRVKLGYVLLATLRGIPQVFAGDEYGIRSTDRSKGHATLRQPLPLPEQVTAEQKELYQFQSKLFQFRKSEPILHTGKMMHFASRDNTYAYFRYTDEGAVFVFINASESSRTVPTDHYEEILRHYHPIGTNILDGKTYNLSKKDIVVEPLSALVIKLPLSHTNP